MRATPLRGLRLIYLLDTNVLSELRKVGDGKADPNVTTWFSSVDAAHLYLSGISLMQLELGILRVERRDAPQGRAAAHLGAHPGVARVLGANST